MRRFYDGLAVAVLHSLRQKCKKWIPQCGGKWKTPPECRRETKRMQKEGGKLNLINYVVEFMLSRRLYAQFIATLLAKQ